MDKFSLNLPEGFAENPGISEAKLFVFDFDGVIGTTEIVQKIAFKLLLEEQIKKRWGKDVEFTLDCVQREAIQPSIAEILSDYKKTYDLKDSVEDLLKRQAELYRDVADRHNVQPNPRVLAMLKYAQDNNIPCIVATNGRAENVDWFLKRWNLPYKFAGIYPSEGKERQALSNPSSKAVFLNWYLREHTISANRVVMVEDNPGTLEKLEAKVPGIQTVLVRHELNRDSPYRPTTGIVIDGYCPAIYDLYAGPSRPGSIVNPLPGTLYNPRQG